MSTFEERPTSENRKGQRAPKGIKRMAMKILKYLLILIVVLAALITFFYQPAADLWQQSKQRTGRILQLI